jgi:hypothetical protein
VLTGRIRRHKRCLEASLRRIQYKNASIINPHCFQPKLNCAIDVLDISLPPFLETVDLNRSQRWSLLRTFQILSLGKCVIGWRMGWGGEGEGEGGGERERQRKRRERERERERERDIPGAMVTGG